MSLSLFRLVEMLSRAFRRLIVSSPTSRAFSGTEFGNLSENLLKDPVAVNDELDEDEKHDAKVADIYRPRPSDFLQEIRQHLENRDLKRALDVLEVKMKQECVRPTDEHFRLLITECSRRGYVKKAFDLHRSYNERGLPKFQSIYSDLFNACFHCPFPSYALEKANRLRRIMANTGEKPNHVVINNMIKAFGKCGDLETAFEIADEATIFSESTFNHLLSGCLSDKESGFRHALTLWRRVLKDKGGKSLKPNVQSFSLMLRIAHECSLGREELREDLLLEAMDVKQAQEYISDKRKISEGILPIEEGSAMEVKAPHFLQGKVDFKRIVGLSKDIKTPYNRLLLIGGHDGFLEEMKRANVVPNVKIFTQLLNLLPGDSVAEDDLLTKMDAHEVSPDIGFFNVLIKRRALRRDYELAREGTLKEIHKRGLELEVRTYGCLAMTCSNSERLKSLLDDMSNGGIRLNNEILGALVSQTARRYHIMDMVRLLEEARKANLKASPRLIQKFEAFISSYKNEILKYERGDPSYNSRLNHDIHEGFPRWKIFLNKYEAWLKVTDMEDVEHEWKQYLTTKEVNDERTIKKLNEIDA